MKTAEMTELKPGDKVKLSFWSGKQTEIEGTIDKVFPCDGNACDDHCTRSNEPDQALLITEPCAQDYLGLVEDDQMAYFRYQIYEINGVNIPGGGE